MDIQIKRAYDTASSDDGYRALVDRLWPRGIKKEALRLDKWYKDISPSTELRQWFQHDHAKFDTFRAQYINELKQSDLPQQLLQDAAKSTAITLVYSAKDTEHNQAVVLQEYLKSIK